MIPKREKCLTVLMDQEIPLHIIRHSESVERVALFIAGELNNSGRNHKGENDLDLQLVSAGALLHDIAKLPAMERDITHSDMGGDMVTAMGFYKVAPLVRQHVFLDDYETDELDEAAVVNYSDKRVTHDIIVTMDERFTDLYERYGKRSHEAMEHVKYLHRMSLILERRLFDRLPFGPDEIRGLMK